MGVLYSAFPIDKEVRQWLAEDGITAPASDGQAPTPAQLQAALQSLDDQAITFNISDGVWQAQIDDPESPETEPWTIIRVLDYTSPDGPCKFYFEKGWPDLIIKVVHRISQQCGPIAVVPDTGCPAAVVDRDSDIDNIINTWEHING